MSTQNLAQRSVHQVRCGVIQTNTGATSLINISLHRVAHFQRTRSKFTDVTNRLAVFLRIFHRKGEVSAFQFAFIANLTAGFRIEWRLIQHDHSFLACIDGINRFTINKQRSHFAVQFQMVIAFKFRCTVNTDHCVVIGTKAAGFARATTLLFHCSFKTSFVNFDVALTTNISRQVNREAIGVVQTESSFTIQRITRKFCQLFIQQRQTALQSTSKLLFFSLQHLLNLRLLAFQVFTRRAHNVDQRTNQFVEEGFFRAEHITVTHCATNDTTQYITTVFIGRHYAIRDQERTRTNVVSDYAQRFIAQIGCASDFRYRLDQRAEQVDVIVRVNVLQHRSNTLQTHTGIYRRLRQRFHRAIGLAVELHEDDVPDLNVAVAVFFRASRRAPPNVVAVIVEDFGARAARTSVTHLPEVVRCVWRTFVIADANNTFARDPYFFFPDFVGFVVAFIDGNPQTLFRQGKPFLVSSSHAN